MYTVTRGKLSGWIVAAALLQGLAVAGPAKSEEAIAAPSAPQASAPWPSRVEAVYRVSFSGIDLGDFKFQSTVEGSSYSLSGNAELSHLFGLFNFSSILRSAGNVASETPRPLGYTFDFRTNGRGGSIRMNFADGAVAGLTTVPPSSPTPGAVPVREQHLKDVVDPLTAVMVLSRGKASNPCGRKIRVFDGKQRFDLLLSFRRQQRIAELQPSGQPSIVYVCRVRYIPIAGHRNNDETREMAANAGIEVALRPVPSANLLVPYQITVPTAAGTAVLTSQRVDIVTGRRQIALVH